MRAVCLLALSFASCVFAQLENDTLTVQSSRATLAPPDQVLFFVTITSAIDATLDQVVASLQGSGITAADFARLGTLNIDPSIPLGPPALQWSFETAVPFAKLPSTVEALIALQVSLQKNGGNMLTFQPEGSRASAAAQAAQPCSLSGLVTDAQAHAQKLAAAAGLVAGPILSISDQTFPGLSEAFVSRVVFSITAIQGIVTAQQIPSLPVNCGVEVKFKLLRLQQ